MIDRPTYRFLPKGEPSSVPAVVRLRRALKYLLRVCGFRAVSVEEVQAPAPPPVAESAPSQPGD